jgi:hypothetical protein
MKVILKATLVAMGIVLASACSSVTIDLYADNKPQLVAEKYFNGQLTAYGIVKDRSGQVIRYFSAKIKAYWVDGIGTLDESFVFDDGERQTRVWKLKPNADGTYVATAGDVIGEGKMKVAGNSLFLDYVLRIPYGDDTIDLRIDDRMYLISEKVLLNESVMTKWGLKVGQITLVIEKE